MAPTTPAPTITLRKGAEELMKKRLQELKRPLEAKRAAATTKHAKKEGANSSSSASGSQEKLVEAVTKGVAEALKAQVGSSSATKPVKMASKSKIAVEETAPTEEEAWTKQQIEEWLMTIPTNDQVDPRGIRREMGEGRVQITWTSDQTRALTEETGAERREIGFFEPRPFSMEDMVLIPPEDRKIMHRLNSPSTTFAEIQAMYADGVHPVEQIRRRAQERMQEARPGAWSAWRAAKDQHDAIERWLKTFAWGADRQ